MRPERIEGHAVVRALLGLVLLAAGTAKLYEVATGTAVTPGLPALSGFLPGLALFESLFGLWLLSGRAPRLTHRLTLGCFGVFFLFAGLPGRFGSDELWLLRCGPGQPVVRRRL